MKTVNEGGMNVCEMTLPGALGKVAQKHLDLAFLNLSVLGGIHS